MATTMRGRVERERATEDAGCDIKLDTRQRELYRNSEVSADCIKIISWNMNRVCTELEKVNVNCMLRRYDVALTEVKTSQSVHISNYMSYRGRTIGAADRGGIMVSVKNHLYTIIHNVDLGITGQLWQFNHRGENVIESK